MSRLLCIFGWHDWRIAAEVPVEGTGYTDDPGDFESGGVDYVIQCARCPSAWVSHKRGFWIKPKYPRLTQPQGGGRE